MSETLRRLVDWRMACVAVIAIVLTVGGAGRLRAAVAPPTTAQSSDVLPALLSEVHGLREAMEQIASTAPRVQLSVARLQLEEGRINTMLHRLDAVHDGLATAQRELNNTIQEQKGIEARLTENPNDPHREEFTGMLETLKHVLVDRRAVVTRLSGEDAQLTQDIAAEQTRWTEINQRLDEMERALTRR